MACESVGRSEVRTPIVELCRRAAAKSHVGPSGTSPLAHSKTKHIFPRGMPLKYCVLPVCLWHTELAACSWDTGNNKALRNNKPLTSSSNDASLHWNHRIDNKLFLSLLTS